jgi:hypothetical protein
MNYAEFIRRQTDISVADAIEILTPIFLRAIQWNPDGDISKIKAEKVQFIEDTIVRFVNTKGINGNLVYYNEMDDNGFPRVDPEEYVSQKLSRTRSIVDCKQLLNLFHYNFKKDYLVPSELEELLNVTTAAPSPVVDSTNNDNEPANVVEQQSNPTAPSEDNQSPSNTDNSGLMIICAIEIGAYCNKHITGEHTPTVDEVYKHLASVLGKSIIDKSQVNALLGNVVELMIKKNKRQEMIALAELKHKPLNDAKDRIRVFIRKELERESGQHTCSCMHSQLARYVLKQATKGIPEACLEYGDKKLTDEMIKELVKDIIDPLRVQETGAELKKCVIHGLNN